MLTTALLGSLRATRTSFVFARTLSASKAGTDPIQQLFVEKIKEYRSKSSGGKLVEATPEIEKELKTELEKLEKQFGGGSGIDMTKFPTFKFEEPVIDPIDEQAAAKK